MNYSMLLHPSADAQPVYSWLWNAPVTRESVVRGLDEMLSGGIRAFYVIPEPPEFRPGKMETHLSPPYLSEEYMLLVRFTMEQAKLRGMSMWLYDEGGWPSGGAAGRVVAADESARHKTLSRRMIRAAEGKDAANAIAFTDDRGNRVSPEDVPPDTLLRCYEVIPTRSSTAALTDTLEPLANELFLKITHEKYREYCADYLGSAQASLMFTDEPSAPAPAWPDGFAGAFLARFGYDMRDHLEELWEENTRNGAKRDYGMLVDELFRKNAFDRQRAWCRANHILFGGHLPGEHELRKGIRSHDMLYLLSGMDVPGVDVIWRQIFPFRNGLSVADHPFTSCPSKDWQSLLGKIGLPGNTLPFFPRLAASAAVQNGTDLALCEVFGVYGAGLTFEQMRYVLGFLAIRGINIFNLMDTGVSRDAFYPFAERPQFHPDMPGWFAMKAFNDWIARLSVLTRMGRRRVRTALVMPYETAMEGGDSAEALRESLKKTGTELEKQGIDFDLINLRGIEESEVREGCLFLGKARYSRVVVPAGTALPESVSGKIACLSGDDAPLISCENGFAFLRLQMRELENGDAVLLLFNEGREPIHTVFTPEYHPHCCWFCPDSGELRPIQKNERGNGIALSLHPGETKALLMTQNALLPQQEPEKSAFTDLRIPLAEGTQRVTGQMLLSPEGIRCIRSAQQEKPASCVPWEQQFGMDFSGEVTYTLPFRLSFTPRGRVEITFPLQANAARVSVNGKEAGVLFGPCSCTLRTDSRLFRRGDNTLTITVANTAANQFVFSAAEQHWNDSQLTPYHAVEKAFERESLHTAVGETVFLRFEPAAEPRDASAPFTGSDCSPAPAD